ncbi:MAG: hypothetical protein GY841_12385 [FCB group bacterium]|nr:hypothetical protein [FCB group bacterium]
MLIAEETAPREDEKLIDNYRGVTFIGTTDKNNVVDSLSIGIAGKFFGYSDAVLRHDHGTIWVDRQERIDLLVAAELNGKASKVVKLVTRAGRIIKVRATAVFKNGLLSGAYELL